MFEVINEVQAANGMTYTIRNTQTRETRLLEDCALLDMEVFDEYDFEMNCVAVA